MNVLGSEVVAELARMSREDPRRALMAAEAAYTAAGCADKVERVLGIAGRAVAESCADGDAEMAVLLALAMAATAAFTFDCVAELAAEDDAAAAVAEAEELLRGGGA